MQIVRSYVGAMRQVAVDFKIQNSFSFDFSYADESCRAGVKARNFFLSWRIRNDICL